MYVCLKPYLALPNRWILCLLLSPLFLFLFPLLGEELYDKYFTLLYPKPTNFKFQIWFVWFVYLQHCRSWRLHHGMCLYCWKPVRKVFEICFPACPVTGLCSRLCFLFLLLTSQPFASTIYFTDETFWDALQKNHRLSHFLPIPQQWCLQRCLTNHLSETLVPTFALLSLVRAGFLLAFPGSIWLSVVLNLLNTTERCELESEWGGLFISL